MWRALLKDEEPQERTLASCDPLELSLGLSLQRNSLLGGNSTVTVSWGKCLPHKHKELTPSTSPKS